MTTEQTIQAISDGKTRNDELRDLLEEAMCDFVYLKKYCADASLNGWLQTRIEKIDKTLKQQEATNEPN